LQTAGLVVADPDGALLPVSTYVAETAAGLLDAAARVDLHTRLAELTPPAEAARHLAAAGDLRGAHRRALVAADQSTGGDRAALLLFACELDVPVDLRVRLAAADALLSAGRPAAAARVLVAADALVPAGRPSATGGERSHGGVASPLSLSAELDFPDPSAAVPGAELDFPNPSAAGPCAELDFPDQRAAVHRAGSEARGPGRDYQKPHAMGPGARPSSSGPPVAGADSSIAERGLPVRSRGWATAGPGGDSDAMRSLELEADVLRGEALLQVGDPAAARAAVRSVPDAAAVPVVAGRDRVLLLAELALDPAAAQDLADKIAARHPRPTAGVAAALAAVQAHFRTPGWDAALGAAATAGGDPLISRWAAWLLVEQLAADGRLTESASVALRAAKDSAAELAYGWQTRFAAAADWALALHGSTTETGDDTAPDGTVAELWDGVDGVLRRAGNLADRALPDEARGYATAATALIEADTGLLAAARAHLDAGPRHPATSWVAQETAWLDGQPDRAVRLGGEPGRGLLAGLRAITALWAAHDLGADAAPVVPGGLPAAARRTLTAWATGTGFGAAAEGWRPIAVRERIRCLLAAGLTDTDPGRAVEALLSAEKLADAAGLTVLAGRARRGLRRHHVHRDTRSKRSGDQLTRRETDVLRLVAAGEPTRRIAGQLGISAETVDTHIRAGMRKLGARTRTEAAALAFAHETFKDGR
ncbi:LuxR C-terminal-related transcriptional regulator, partial [Actinoplanes sp. NPDC049596]